MVFGIGSAFKKGWKKVFKPVEKEFRRGRDKVLHVLGEVSGVRWFERRKRRHKWKRIRAAEAAAVEKAKEETARQLALAKKAVETASRPSAGASSSSSAPPVPVKSQALLEEAQEARKLWQLMDNQVENTTQALRDTSWNVYHLQQLVSSNDERIAWVQDALLRCLEASEEAAGATLIMEEE